ncbi:MAG: hypothetical protein FWF82_07270 [Oscillospiraceae bacterium]|nr:hypothetical protein [Oscillospiraceae bacterium]
MEKTVAMIISLVMSLTACGVAVSESQPDSEQTSETANTTSAVTVAEVSETTAVPTEAPVFIEMDSAYVGGLSLNYRFYDGNLQHLTGKTITSNEELGEYLNNILSLDPPYKDKVEESAAKQLDFFDDDFFENNIIVTYAYMEGSASVSHMVKSLEIDGEERYINIERYSPDWGLDVIAYCTFFIKIDRQYYNGNDINIKIDNVSGSDIFSPSVREKINENNQKEQ